jgi:2-oxoglutarate ferredoxin oxidoreductase subunit alpha
VETSKNLSVLIAGPAGAGIFSSSLTLGKIFLRHGLNVFITNEYPSLIRGGHQWAQVRASLEETVFSHQKKVDIVLALDKPSIEKHTASLKTNGIIICDEEDASSLAKNNGQMRAFPLRKIVKEMNAPSVTINSIGLGIIVGILNGNIEIAKKLYDEQFRGKKETADLNKQLFKMGYEYGKELSNSFQGYKLPQQAIYSGNEKRLLIDGNTAVALGALSAGLTFFVSYPMTPASPILHFLAEVQKEVGIVVFQPESEIAAINMAIGAAYAGARSMVATSGGGFSLMVEALGQAAMTETPILIVEVQRPGPSTGLPTHTAQGDLRFVIHASQGEFPRVVLAPGDPYQAYVLANRGLNIAWKYQVPVILLSDKYLGESYWTVPDFPELGIEEPKISRENVGGFFPRYKITEDGVSPLIFPGTPGSLVYANTSEHDEYGFGTIEPSKVKEMQDKRLRKYRLLREEAEKHGIETIGDGDIVVVTWGSTKQVVLEALKGVSGVKLVQVIWMEPFPKNKLLSEIKDKRLLVIENNSTGQLASLIRENLFREPDGLLLKYDGRQFFPEDVQLWINSYLER